MHGESRVSEPVTAGTMLQTNQSKGSHGSPCMSQEENETVMSTRLLRTFEVDCLATIIDFLPLAPRVATN